MIMPCMNSTSACDRGGSVAFVDAGSVLLGLPGAPGCTTTGSVCCAHITEEKRPVEQKNPAEALAASNMPAVTFTISGNPCRIWARAAGQFPFDSTLNIICRVSHRCRSIRFNCGTAVNPTLG